jgi:hypothetical protein
MASAERTARPDVWRIERKRVEQLVDVPDRARAGQEPVRRRGDDGALVVGEVRAQGVGVRE